jgi:hypothetical protein
MFLVCSRTQHLELADLVRHTDVDLEIEPTEPSQGKVDAVGTVHGAHHHVMSVHLEPVHEREQLEDDVAHHLPVGFVPFGHDGVDLIDEDDGGFSASNVFLRLLSLSLAKK